MELLKKYGYSPSVEEIESSICKIAASLDGLASEDVYKECFSCMDITTLHNNDMPQSVLGFVEKVNGLRKSYPAYPDPASICVFSNFIGVVCSSRRSSSIHATAVAGCFPTTQTMIEVKELECSLAVKAGADEVDVILPLASFLSGDEKTAFDDLCRMKASIDSAAAGRKVVFKVILETGLLVSPEKIAEASFLAMEAGADFIKTSTGKVEVNATPMSAYIMCECIKKYYEMTGRMVGFKAAGGISTAKDAISYYFIADAVLEKNWLCPEYFRLGVSRLGNSLMSAIEQKTVTYF